MTHKTNYIIVNFPNQNLGLYGRHDSKFVLEKKSIDKLLDDKWRRLKKGINKISIKNDLGNPDRIGKYSNGDEIWGFKKFTLRFDKNGKLKNWTKPFSP